MSPLNYVEAFQAHLQQPFPRRPPAFLEMEQHLYRTAAEVGDHLVLMKIVAAHDDPEFVKQAVQEARGCSPVPLVHKGWKETHILMLGGSRMVIKTPYLRQDHRGKRGRKRTRRGRHGQGVYPVLEALGIQDGVSAATRSEIALYMVQSGSYQEAKALLERRGLRCDISTLTRVSLATAHTALGLRDAALEAAQSLPIPKDAPLCGKRVRVSTDGGRVRTRRPHLGRKTKKGRHAFSTPWREPRVIVIDVLNEEGRPDPLRLPLYDVVLDDADATFSVIVGYLRLLGAAYAQEVEFISDGADWIWERVDRLVTQAEIAQERLILILDFYHASEPLWAVVDLCQSLSKPQRTWWYQKLRHQLRHEFDEKNWPVGSGQVESAVRRVVNLRFKAPGTFWREKHVGPFLHLRAYFKAGRWDELIQQIISGELSCPHFNPDQDKLRKSLKIIKNPSLNREHQHKKAA